MLKQQHKELNELQTKQLETARRNEAIAELIGFKKYIPHQEVKKVHEKQWPGSMKWFYVSGIGRYNSFELKFNSDWNWLMSAVIEMKKYIGTHNPKNLGKETLLDRIYWKLQNIWLLEFDLHLLWTLISDYALEMKRIKESENKNQPILKNSDEWYKILYPDHKIVVMDPDGWDRENWQFSWYEELITEEEFKDRVFRSTTLRQRNNI